MTEEQLETLHEAYYAAVHHIVTGGEGLRQRLRAAVAELEKCRPFCAARRKDVYEVKAMLGLPRPLAVGERLEAMTEQELEDLAQALRRVRKEVSDALTARAIRQMEAEQE